MTASMLSSSVASDKTAATRVTLHHWVSYEGCLEDLAPIECILSERLVIVDLRMLTADPRRHELLICHFGRATLVTQILRLVKQRVITSSRLLFDRWKFFIIDFEQFIFKYVLSCNMTALRSVSCVTSSLSTLAILSVLLACYSTAAIVKI